MASEPRYRETFKVATSEANAGAQRAEIEATIERIGDLQLVELTMTKRAVCAG